MGVLDAFLLGGVVVEASWRCASIWEPNTDFKCSPVESFWALLMTSWVLFKVSWGALGRVSGVLGAIMRRGAFPGPFDFPLMGS